MSDVDAQCPTGRIGAVLDTLIVDDYYSAIHNLEILKAKLLDTVKRDAESLPKKHEAP